MIIINIVEDFFSINNIETTLISDYETKLNSLLENINYLTYNELEKIKIEIYTYREIIANLGFELPSIDLESLILSKKVNVKDKLSFGVFSKKLNRALCNCGCLLEIYNWTNQDNFGCLCCNNISWVSLKNIKGSWKKIKEDIDVYLDGNNLIIDKYIDQYNVDWEQNKFIFNKKSVMIEFNLETKDVYYISNNKRKVATESNLKSFLSGNYSNVSLLEKVISLYNSQEKYWKLEGTSFISYDLDLFDIYLYFKYPHLYTLNSFLENNGTIKISNYIDNLNLGEYKPHKILGLPKFIFKYENISKFNMKNILSLKSLFNNYGSDNLKLFLDLLTNREYFYVDKLSDNYNYLLSKGYKAIKINNYITRVHENQAINSYKDILTLFRDYVQMSYDMGIGWLKYPRSLKLVHDVRQRDFKVVLNEKQTEFFKKRYKDNNHLSYESGDYCILLPKDPIDLSKEGQDLNHCVSSYVLRVIENNSLIVFLRYKDSKDVSLITVEISYSGSIVQAKGRNNRKLNYKEKDFLLKWAKNKGLTLSL